VPGTVSLLHPARSGTSPKKAWHVVQQAQGRVTPTKQLKEGVRLNEDESLEHDADAMEKRRTLSRRGGRTETGGYVRTGLHEQVRSRDHLTRRTPNPGHIEALEA
jgi:hypothetical protein